MDVKIVKYIFGEESPLECLSARDEVPGRSEKEYFAIYENRAVSKLWESFGNHENSVGNWGGFETVEEMRGRGIGRQVLDFWLNDLNTRSDKPLAYFCTAGKQYLADLYRGYGFRPALKNTTYGYLYRPVGNSPETFQEFCEQYYTDTEKLRFRDADYDYRVEIDCLFKFAMADLGLPFNFDSVDCISDWIIKGKKEKVEFIFNDDNRVVGWAFTPVDGEKQIKIYPKYESLLRAI